jgi:MinD superfamily P-loop ATPase
MKIAILSGKGGTGKTFVATNLARSAESCVYLDCDVEEPNGHLFLNGPLISTKTVSLPIPRVNDSLCDGCKKCVDFCRFNALAFVKNRVIVFDKICHSCGGCKIVCPQDAIYEVDREIGQVESRVYKNTQIFTGKLLPGEESGTSIIQELFHQIKPEDSLVIIDAPPGSACVVMDSIKDADYCILVAEPSIFGSHNLKMVHELVKLFKKPHAVVLNKSLGDENPSKDYCIENNVDILADIPFDAELGKLTAEGKLVVEYNDEAKTVFKNLLDKVLKEVQI